MEIWPEKISAGPSNIGSIAFFDWNHNPTAQSAYRNHKAFRKLHYYDHGWYGWPQWDHLTYTADIKWILRLTK